VPLQSLDDLGALNMQAPKILLLGCNGQVGWELQRALAPLGPLTALDFDTSGPWQADFSQPEALLPLLAALAPDVIVNAAAHTAVDRAETEAELAQAINATAPGVLAEYAAAHGVSLVHYSTDYVFDGSGNQPRTEDAPTGPLSVYGRTKLEGEHAIRASGCRHRILRTSWVYAARGGNFARTMLRLAAERDTLRVIDDQIGAPTGADLLADVTALALSRLRTNPQLAGTYHCVAAGETSWHGYARHVIAWAHAQGQPLQATPASIEPVPTTAYPTPARRPLNSRLDTTRLRETFGLTLPHWQTGVERMLREVLGR
jgi:dTDP-4-dehydrorhamnose reductase